MEVGVDGGCEDSDFFSTLNLVLPGVLALTRRSWVHRKKQNLMVQERFSDAVQVQGRVESG